MTLKVNPLRLAGSASRAVVLLPTMVNQVTLGIFDGFRAHAQRLRVLVSSFIRGLSLDVGKHTAPSHCPLGDGLIPRVQGNTFQAESNVEAEVDAVTVDGELPRSDANVDVAVSEVASCHGGVPVVLVLEGDEGVFMVEST